MSMGDRAEELRRAMDERFEHFAQQIRERDAAIAEQKAKITEISRDFEFNLNIIHERDAELETMDEQIAHLQQELKHKEADIADLRGSLSEAKQATEAKQREVHDMTIQHQQEVSQLKQRADAQRHQLEQQLRRKDDEIDSVRRESEAVYHDSEQSFEAQRTTLLHTLEQQYSAREQLWKKDEANLRTLLEAAQHKVKEREDEIARLREAALESRLQLDRDVDRVRSEAEESVFNISTSFSQEKQTLMSRIRELEQKVLFASKEHSVQLESLRRELDSQRIRSKELEDEKVALSESHDKELEELSKQLETQLAHKEDQLRTAESARQQLHSEVHALRSTTTTMKWELASSTERLQIIESQLEQRTLEATEHREDSLKATERLHEMGLELAQERAAVSGLRREKESLESTLGLARDEVQRLKKALALCEEVNKQRANISDDFDRDFGKVRLDGDYFGGAFETKISELEAKVSALESKNDSLKSQNTTLLGELKAAREDMEAFIQHTNKKEKEKEEQQQQARQHQEPASSKSVAQYAELMAENKLQKREIEKLQSKIDSLQLKLVAASNNSNSNNHSGAIGGGSESILDTLDGAQLEHYLSVRLKLTELTKESQKYKKKYERCSAELEATLAEVHTLRGQLQDSQIRLSHLEVEKERLLDCNNMWRSDFVKLVETKTYAGGLGATATTTTTPPPPVTSTHPFPNPTNSGLNVSNYPPYHLHHQQQQQQHSNSSAYVMATTMLDRQQQQHHQQQPQSILHTTATGGYDTSMSAYPAHDRTNLSAVPPPTLSDSPRRQHAAPNSVASSFVSNAGDNMAMDRQIRDFEVQHQRSLRIIDDIRKENDELRRRMSDRASNGGGGGGGGDGDDAMQVTGRSH
eukprot:PhM_4_TR16669/c0_g1_i1/m.33630